jgi:plasmid stabilization system protein ParE
LGGAAFDRLELVADAAPGVVTLILEATAILQDHPLIGRIVEDGRRELVISRGKTGYIALYRYDEARDIVFVLALRHQREAGFAAE